MCDKRLNVCVVCGTGKHIVPHICIVGAELLGAVYIVRVTSADKYRSVAAGAAAVQACVVCLQPVSLPL
jgi:hypothetical protein